MIGILCVLLRHGRRNILWNIRDSQTVRAESDSRQISKMGGRVLYYFLQREFTYVIVSPGQSR